MSCSSLHAKTGILEICILSAGGVEKRRKPFSLALVNLEGECKVMSLATRRGGSQEAEAKMNKMNNNNTTSRHHHGKKANKGKRVSPTLAIIAGKKVREIGLESHPSSLLFDVIDYFGQSSIEIDLYSKFLGKKRRVGSCKFPLADALLRQRERNGVNLRSNSSSSGFNSGHHQIQQPLVTGAPPSTAAVVQPCNNMQQSPALAVLCRSCVPWRHWRNSSSDMKSTERKCGGAVTNGAHQRKKSGINGKRAEMAPVSTTTMAADKSTVTATNSSKGSTFSATSTTTTPITTTTTTITTTATTAATTKPTVTTENGAFHTPMPTAKWNIRWYALGGGGGTTGSDSTKGKAGPGSSGGLSYSGSAKSSSAPKYVRLALRFIPLPVPPAVESNGNDSSDQSRTGGGGAAPAVETGGGGGGGGVAGLDVDGEEECLGQLHLSAGAGHLRMVTALLELSGRAYPKVNHLDIRCSNLLTPLDYAIMAGRVHTVKNMMHNYGRMVARAVTPGKPTPLHTAVQKGDMAILKIVTNALKHHKALITVTDAVGTTTAGGGHGSAPTAAAALSASSSSAASTTATTTQASSSAWMSVWDNHGDTPLTLACRLHSPSTSSSTPSLTFSPSAPPPPPPPSSSSLPPPWFIKDDNEAVVLHLIKMGAGVAVRDRNGLTPLMNAAKAGNAKAVAALLAAPPKIRKKEFGVVTLGRLASMACEPCARDATGQTAMFLAAANGHDGVLQVLVKAGVPFRTVDDQGTTPLHVAAANGQLNCVVRLVELLQMPPTLSPHSKQMHSGGGGGGGANSGSGSGSSTPWHGSGVGAGVVGGVGAGVVGGGGGAAAVDNSCCFSTILLDGGPCTISSMDCFGRTPAALALSNGHVEVVDYLTAKIGDRKKQVTGGDDDVTDDDDEYVDWDDEEDEYIYECVDSETAGEKDKEDDDDEDDDEDEGEDNDEGKVAAVKLEVKVGKVEVTSEDYDGDHKENDCDNDSRTALPQQRVISPNWTVYDH